MTRWRYEATPIAGGGPVYGHMPADTASDVRACLRRAGLRTLRVRPIRSRRMPHWLPASTLVRRWLRARRRHAKAELLESLATLIHAGVSMTEALETLSAGRRRQPLAAEQPGSPTHQPAGGIRSHRQRRSSSAILCEGLSERIRSGCSVAEALASQPHWFDQAELAMIRAGEHRGEMAAVLHALAQRHERADEVSSRIASALAYPAIVTLVGLAVVVFLSTRTLPQLVGVLTEAGVPPPPLTVGVMAVGQAIAGGWIWLVLAGVATPAAAVAASRSISRSGMALPRWTGSLAPKLLREPVLAAACIDLAELLRVGVPLTDSLRVVAPSLPRGPGRNLAPLLLASAERLERGESFGQTLDDPRWFDGELIRLIVVGESGGELHNVLRQLGESRARRIRRRVDRLATMLEPAVIIVLAALIGLVVMSAVQPMLRLQEVI